MHPDVIEAHALKNVFAYSDQTFLENSWYNVVSLDKKSGPVLHICPVRMITMKRALRRYMGLYSTVESKYKNTSIFCVYIYYDVFFYLWFVFCLYLGIRFFILLYDDVRGNCVVMNLHNKLII